MGKIVTKTFPRGIHFDDKKLLSKECAIEVMPSPSEVFVGLAQHIGAPAQAIVKAGDKVKQGQLIATLNGNVSANVFASISGEVVNIVSKKNNLGISSNYVHIKSDNSNEKVALSKMMDINADSIKQRIKEAGIIGLGGAGFPTHVKVSPNKPVDTLIINAAECEPYLTCDYRLMLEKTEGFVKGVKLLATALQVQNVLIGIEANKMDAAKILIDLNMDVVVLKKKYPQGAEKHLIYACTKRKVPVAGLPMDVGVVVSNVATAYAVFEAVELNKPLYERVLTVSGGGVKSPKNLTVKNGTSYASLFEFCGGISDETVKVIAGGPMMGQCVANIENVTSKTDSGLLALVQGEAYIKDPTPCINCGKCASVCPMHLMPMYIDFYSLVNDTSNAVKYGALNCCECGSCAYVCPAKRAIVQSVKLTKSALKGRK